MSANVNQAAASFGAGRFCGVSARGVSKLTGENMREIEAHRMRERPISWANLAIRYDVNEVDLRRLFAPVNDDQPKPKASPPPVALAATACQSGRSRLKWTDAQLANLYLAKSGQISVREACRRNKCSITAIRTWMADQ